MPSLREAVPVYLLEGSGFQGGKGRLDRVTRGGRLLVLVHLSAPKTILLFLDGSP